MDALASLRLPGQADIDRQSLRRIAVLAACGLGLLIGVFVLVVASAVVAVRQVDADADRRERAQVEGLLRALDGAGPLNLAQLMALEAPRLVPLADIGPGELFVAIDASHGLAWQPGRPATAVFMTLAPLRILAVLVAFGVIAVLGWRMIALGQRIDLRRAEASQLALTDMLTGLANRRAFELELNRRIETARRGGAPFLLAVIDLDGFKAVNDRYGHAMGDVVLCLLAQALGRSAGTDDLAARLGGDEFAVLASDVDGATFEANFTRALAQASDFAQLGVGASLGFTIGTGAESAAALVNAADTALYEAKRRIERLGHAA